MSANPVAIVTGAGSGIGRQCALLLAEAGYDVALVARTQRTLHETAELVRDTLGGQAAGHVLSADVTDPDHIRNVVERTLTKFGRVDALANIAGAAPMLPIKDVTPELWRRCIDVNLGAIVLATAAVWPMFEKQRSGVIVNVSSLASVDPFPGLAIYAAAKVGVNMFTLCTAREGEPIGVKAVCIAPGAVETPMLRENFPVEMIPAHQTLSPDTVAAAIRDCITGRRTFEPGETILMPSGDR